ncbi:ABC transporter permease [Dactylosporangium matsuzakiense]|uniref:Transport permease protein n=1 Tax=Dactylosporangium matsuzakiense TaxID=53360 RepID=A0A9W6KH48_9ACTN|nr:ABC transporter permease [Dactylosporangium matsuzakiense]UWZ44426.1 ABC transporter permease [Dactylosporangium matsuzakiense]GLK99408.1 transport permease protein [Dactylosporangium matsuzakiense]
MSAGWHRGLIELRQSLTQPADLFNHCFWPTLMLVTLYFLRGHAALLPSVLGMNAAMGMVTMSQGLTADREDGTLLRARATPNGLREYLIGKIISVSGGLVVDLAIFLVPALLIVDAAPAVDIGTALWVLGLGLLATLPLGAVLGALFPTARGQGLLTLPILVVIGISGIFYPITVLPGWVQAVAQAFPMYWLGLGMRTAFLPGEAAHPVATAAVLGAWAVAGLALAPWVLRKRLIRQHRVQPSRPGRVEAR